MTPHREFFNEFKEIKGGSVLLGDNKACSIEGVGSVKIKMHDAVV